MTTAPARLQLLKAGAVAIVKLLDSSLQVRQCCHCGAVHTCVERILAAGRSLHGGTCVVFVLQAACRRHAGCMQRACFLSMLRCSWAEGCVAHTTTSRGLQHALLSRLHDEALHQALRLRGWSYCMRPDRPTPDVEGVELLHEARQAHA
jgi:hypothetical protein